MNLLDPTSNQKLCLFNSSAQLEHNKKLLKNIFESPLKIGILLWTLFSQESTKDLLYLTAPPKRYGYTIKLPTIPSLTKPKSIGSRML